MGDPAGFKKYTRKVPGYLPVEDRIKNYNDFIREFSEEDIRIQAARCMNCGIPYCHALGCPLGNLIPDWNDMVHQGRWRDALTLLHSTNNFPEFTGKICPAPCEPACTLSINDDPVTIKNIEWMIIDRGWKEGWVVPEHPKRKTNKNIAIIGSGPAGLAAAQQLRRAGHKVTVFEKEDRIGGLLRYGIPDFKLEKWIIDRRLEQMKAEGIIFETNVDVGIDISAKYLLKSFDAVCLTAGSRTPRDLPVEGRDLNGVHFAMDFLRQNNKLVSGDHIPEQNIISAKNKKVIVIGGGDTGSDCIGTSIRHGCEAVYQFEILPQPPKTNSLVNPDWPNWPTIHRTSSSQAEGCFRRWSVMTTKLSGKNGKVAKLHGIDVEWEFPLPGKGSPKINQLPGTNFEIDADLVLLAMGFIHVEHGKLVEDLELKLDNRGNIIVNEQYQTSVPSVFSSGDSVLGASLVVKSIAHGREMARAVDEYLMGVSELPSTGNVIK